MSHSLNTWVNGLSGRMGSTVQKKILESEGHTFTGGSGSEGIYSITSEQYLSSKEVNEDVFAGTDLIIDFSVPEGNLELLKMLKKHQCRSKAILIASTGLKREQRDQWKEFAVTNHCSVLFAPNTSLGILLTLQSCLAVAQGVRGKNFDIELIESHHKGKIDSPSGTAKFISEALGNQENLDPVFERRGARKESEIGVFALRGGSVFGEHTIHFMGQSEEISISHKALSRDLFAEGALVMGRWLNQQEKSSHYSLLDIKIENIK